MKHQKADLTVVSSLEIALHSVLLPSATRPELSPAQNYDLIQPHNRTLLLLIS